MREKNMFRKIIIAAAFGISVSAVGITACGGNGNTDSTVTAVQNQGDEKTAVRNFSKEFLQALCDGDTEKMLSLSSEYRNTSLAGIKDKYVEKMADNMSNQFGYGYKMDDKSAEEMFDKVFGIIVNDYIINDIVEDNGKYVVDMVISAPSNDSGATSTLIQSATENTIKTIQDKMFDMVNYNEYMNIHQKDGKDAAMQYLFDGIIPEFIPAYFKEIENNISYKNYSSKLTVEKIGDSFYVSDMDGNTVSEYIENMLNAFSGGSSSGSGFSITETTQSQTGTSTQQTEETTGTDSSAKETGNGTGTVEWYNTPEVEVAGIKYTLPFSYDEIKSEWALEKENENSVVPKHMMRAAVRLVNEKLNSRMMLCSFTNDTDNDVKIEESFITSVSVQNYSAIDGVKEEPSVILPGGITWGSTVEQVLSAYGTPDKSYDSEYPEKGYNYTYRYKNEKTGKLHTLDLSIGETIGVYGMGYSIN